MSNCHTCKYKANIPGDTHISCNLPLFTEKDRYNLSIIAMSNFDAFNSHLKENFGFTTSESAFRSGWFMFPLNFDPCWIEGSCNKHSDLVGDAVELKLFLNSFSKGYSFVKHCVDTGSFSKEDKEYEDISNSNQLFKEAFNLIPANKNESDNKETFEKFKEKAKIALDFYKEKNLYEIITKKLNDA